MEIVLDGMGQGMRQAVWEDGERGFRIQFRGPNTLWLDAWSLNFVSEPVGGYFYYVRRPNQRAVCAQLERLWELLLREIAHTL